MDFMEFDDSGFWLEPDRILANIVATMVNIMEMPIGVTVYMKGVVISGALVSEQEYLSTLTETFRSVAREATESPSEEELKMIDEAFDFTPLAESPSSFDMSDDDESEDEQALEGIQDVRYLHLKDFSVLMPEPQMTFAGSNFPILRLRLTAIDGWMLGHATPMDFNIDDDKPNNGSEILH